ncbi:MAG TPA: phosphatase PAP2 family protein [Rhizobiales bacterium]|nr:phosphatase PAP2 family protein [Hyphomicrobiales bacterium]
MTGKTGLAPFSSPWAAASLGIALVLALLFFHRFPAIDRAVSAFFFVAASCPAGQPDGAICGSFPAAHVAILGEARQFLQYLPTAIAAGLFAAYLARLATGTPVRDPSMTPLGTVLLAYLLSVVLLVNGLLKPFSGRPRPLYSEPFGGALPFVPAGEFTRYCPSNCSFVSGEAAAAAWLICAVALLPPRYASLRLPAFAAAIVYTVATGALRISFGAHYLSDVVVPALSTLLIFAILAGFEARPRSTPRLGESLRRPI